MKVLVTRPRAQAAEFGAALQAAGFEPVYFPVIEIHPMEDLSALDAALAEIERYAWVIFTSANGVEIFFNRLNSTSERAENVEKTMKISALSVFSAVRFAAIGNKTAELLRRLGIEPAFVPGEFVSESVAPGLGDLTGKRVLLPCAENAREALPEAIRAAGGLAEELIVYRTLSGEVDAPGLAALRAGVEWLTFTSPSTVKHFAEIARQNGLAPMNLPGNPKVACIGPVTRDAAREAGFAVAATAREYTTDGLVEAIRKWRPEIEKT